MEEEKKQWLKMKPTEQWHYNILTSNKGEDYRQHEKACVREYNAKRREQKQPSAAAGASPKTATPHLQVLTRMRKRLKSEKNVKSSLY